MLARDIYHNIYSSSSNIIIICAILHLADHSVVDLVVDLIINHLFEKNSTSTSALLLLLPILEF